MLWRFLFWTAVETPIQRWAKHTQVRMLQVKFTSGTPARNMREPLLTPKTRSLQSSHLLLSTELESFKVRLFFQGTYSSGQVSSISGLSVE